MADDAPSGEGAPTESDDEREPVYIGVDVARFGADKSVLIARRGQRVVAAKVLDRDADTMRVAGEAALMAADLDAQAIFVDENGVGGGVCDRLKEIGAPVYGVQFGRRAPHPTRFANLRSEIFLGVAPPDERPPHRAAVRRNPAGGTPLVALRRHQFRASQVGEQARDSQEGHALSRPRRRPRVSLYAPAVPANLDGLRALPAPAPPRRRPLRPPPPRPARRR